MKAKKNNKIKMIVAIYLAVTLVISAIAVVGVSATTRTVEHTVEVDMTDAGDTYGVTVHKNARMSDTFPSYPHIYTGYSSSTNRARAYNSNSQPLSTWKQFTLYANGGGVVMVNYGSNLSAGQYMIQYEHISGGGFRDDVIWSETY